jgi:hypothetical protein
MKLTEALDLIDEEMEKPFHIIIRTYENKDGVPRISVKFEPKAKGVSDVDTLKTYLDKMGIPQDLNWEYHASKNIYLNADIRELPDAFYYVSVRA